MNLQRSARGLSRVVEGAVAAVCVTYLIMYVVIALQRLHYPFDLEWMEGGMLLHADRVLKGEGIYVPPSMEFIPFIYPPLYPWVLAACAKVLGLGYAVGRTISFLGT